MKPGFWRFPVLLAIAGAAGACSVSQITANFITSPPQTVDVGCGATVEVFDNPVKKLLMVRLNGPAEVSALVCSQPRIALMRKAAEIHFAQTKRTQCRVSDSTELSLWHHQFAYTC